MKKIIAILLTLASSMTLFACSKANTGTVIMYGDMKIQIDDAECQILVSGPFNDSTYFSLPSQIYPTDSALYDEQSRLSKERNERRTEEAKAMYPPQPSISYTRSDGTVKTMEFSYAHTNGSTTAYSYAVGNEEMSIYADSGAFCGYMNIDAQSQTSGDRIVSSEVEAVEFALDFAENVLNVYKLDEYQLKAVRTYSATPDKNNIGGYGITFVRFYKGIFTSLMIIEFNDHCNMRFCISGYDQKRLDFRDSCIDYALAQMNEEKATSVLQSAAAANPEISKIKNVKLRYVERAEKVYDLINGESLTEYSYSQRGCIGYSDILDKTEVYFYYDYTAVMKDGSEKQGCNVISVFLPIDWAEVYGEKESA